MMRVAFQLVCVLSAAMNLSLVSGQAQPPKKEKEEVLDRMVELDQDSWKEEVFMKGEKANVLLVFQDPDCRKMRSAMTDLEKLADHTQGSPKVARVFCNKQGMAAICRQMQVLDFNSPLPQVRLIEELGVYSYNGTLSFEELREFVEDRSEEARNETRLSDNFKNYLRDGDRKPVPRKKMPEGVEIPSYVIDEAFFPSLASLISRWLPRFVKEVGGGLMQNYIHPLFYHIGMGRYSVLGKSLIFIFGIFVPLVIFVYTQFYDYVDNIQDPAPKLVPMTNQQMQQQRQVQQQPQMQQVASNHPDTVQAQKQMYAQQAEYYRQQARAAEAYIMQLENYESNQKRVVENALKHGQTSQTAGPSASGKGKKGKK